MDLVSSGSVKWGETNRLIKISKLNQTTIFWLPNKSMSQCTNFFEGT